MTDIAHDLRLDRRSLLAAGAAGSTAGALVLATGPAHARTSPAYFAHGVASGDPHPTSVVLWTRLTPTASDAHVDVAPTVATVFGIVPPPGATTGPPDSARLHGADHTRGGT